MVTGSLPIVETRVLVPYSIGLKLAITIISIIFNNLLALLKAMKTTKSRYSFFLL